MNYTDATVRDSELIYVHKATGEEHKFRRTLLSTFVRELDSKPFTPGMISKVYNVAHASRWAKRHLGVPKDCIRCLKEKYPHDFYESSANGTKNVCRSCIAVANHANRRKKREVV